MRQASIDQLKGFAIIAVVCYHLHDWRLKIDTKWLTDVTGWCVFAFLFAAGYLHALKSDATPLGEFIRHRAKRLLIPFFLIGVLMCLARQIMEATGAVDLRLRYPPTLLGKIIGHLTLQQPMVAYPLYFLILLLVISVIFKLLQCAGLQRRHLPWLAAGTLAVSTVAWHFTGTLPVTGFGWQSIIIGLFHYTCGHIMSRGTSRQECPSVWWLTGIALVLGAITLADPFVLAAIPAMLFYILDRAGREGWKLKLFMFLGERSGTIFAYHAPFITGSLAVIFHRLAMPDAPNLALNLLATFIICTGLHYVLHRWPVFKWFRV